MPQFMMIAERNYRDFSESAFAPLLEPEAELVRVAYAAGIVRRAWGRKDKPGAIVLLECDSLEAAHDHAEEGCLAGAVWAANMQEFGRLQLEAHALEHVPVSAPDVDILHFETLRLRVH